MRQIALVVLLLVALAGCESRFLPPTLSGNISSARLGSIIRDSAARYSISPGLVRAVVMAESAGNVGAVSSAGAQGLMQLMPATAAGCGIRNAFDPFQNVDCGTRYLRQQLDRYHGNVQLAVAAYNAGPGAVDKYGGVPPYQETQAYVARVLAMYR
jgi:soluble lytic murein transglycosylase-like protein